MKLFSVSLLMRPHNSNHKEANMITIIQLIIALAEPMAHFDTGSDVPNPVLVQEVEKVCHEIEADSDVIIEGHTDIRGDEIYNLKLSKRRADAVKRLIEEKCPNKPKTIRTIGMGKTFPISKLHYENRRVVIHLIQTKPKVIVISESKTEIEQKESPPVQTKIVEKEVVIERKPYNWHITGFVSNGHYNLVTERGQYSATVMLERSWSMGVLVQRRVFDDIYLGGGMTFDSQFILGVGWGLK